MKEPLIIDAKTGELTVVVHGPDLQMICDIDKWDCFFGVCDSGSSLRFTFKPKKKGKKP